MLLTKQEVVYFVLRVCEFGAERCVRVKVLRTHHLGNVVRVVLDTRGTAHAEVRKALASARDVLSYEDVEQGTMWVDADVTRLHHLRTSKGYNAAVSRTETNALATLARYGSASELNYSLPVLRFLQRLQLAKRVKQGRAWAWQVTNTTYTYSAYEGVGEEEDA